MRQMLRLSFLSLIVLAAAACASSNATRPATIAQPDLNARLISSVFFGSSSEAPATIEVSVLNRANVPIEIRKIEVDSPNMVEYTLLPTLKQVRETVQPGEMKRVTVFATAQTTVRRPTEPLVVRTIIEFVAGDKVWREILMARQ